MAKQTPNPLPWVKGMGDGCSGVVDFGYKVPCDNHDEKYHLGGTVEDKLIADDEFYADMCNVEGFWGWVAKHGLADIRYAGVRLATYNYPPGHSMRTSRPKIEAFNWEGPGWQAEFAKRALNTEIEP